MKLIMKNQNPISYLNTLEFIYSYLIEHMKPFCKKKHFSRCYKTLLLAVQDILKSNDLNANLDNFVTIDNTISFNYCTFRERDIDAEVIREEVVTFLWYQETIYFFKRIIECGKTIYKVDKYFLNQQNVKHQCFLIDEIDQLDLEEVDKTLKKVI